MTLDIRRPTVQQKMLLLATDVASRVISLAIAPMVVQTLLVLAQVSVVQAVTRPATAAELLDTSHVTAPSMAAWTALNATNVAAKVTSPVTVRMPPQREASKAAKASRVAPRLEASPELEDLETARCSAIAAVDTVTCPETAPKVPNAITVSPHCSLGYC